MKILNIGSMNIDKVYNMEHIVSPKETADSLGYNEFCGGKGLNQSCAAAKAGAQVFHAGMIGQDGQMLKDMLISSGVDTSLIREIDAPTGHAVIQVDKAGQNSIIIFGGANRLLTNDYVEEVLSQFAAGDILLLQNEVSCNARSIGLAHEKGMTVALNPSPYDKALEECDFSKVDLFILNEVEGAQMAGITSADPAVLRSALQEKYPDAGFVLTLGSEGSCYFKGDEFVKQPIFSVKAVDTTAAGDTFCGYFLAGLAEGLSKEQCMRRAAAASALAVSKKGAAPSIPVREETEAFLEK